MAGRYRHAVPDEPADARPTPEVTLTGRHLLGALVALVGVWKVARRARRRRSASEATAQS